MTGTRDEAKSVTVQAGSVMVRAVDLLALLDENERLQKAVSLGIAYDDLLLRFKGPAVLLAGDNKAIDAAYDKWVAAARKAHRLAVKL